MDDPAPSSSPSLAPSLPGITPHHHHSSTCRVRGPHLSLPFPASQARPQPTLCSAARGRPSHRGPGSCSAPPGPQEPPEGLAGLPLPPPVLIVDERPLLPASDSLKGSSGPQSLCPSECLSTNSALTALRGPRETAQGPGRVVGGGQPGQPTSHDPSASHSRRLQPHQHRLTSRWAYVVARADTGPKGREAQVRHLETGENNAESQRRETRGTAEYPTHSPERCMKAVTRKQGDGLPRKEI